MKILHTADWHLGKKLDRISRLAEQTEVLAEITVIADREEVDAVLIAGDLFDNYNPPAEAAELFYQTLKKLSANGRRAVVAIAGNHDSPDRIEAPDPLAKACGIILQGLPFAEPGGFALSSGLKVTRSGLGFVELQLPGVTRLLRLLLTPYANEFRMKRYLGAQDSEEALRSLLSEFWDSQVKKYSDGEGVNILMAHLFFTDKGQTSLTEPEGEKPILHVGGAQAIFAENVPSGIDYVALGHLHRPQKVPGGNCPIVYAGSPLAYSFAESNQEKSVVIIEVEEEVVYRRVPLASGRRLWRKKFNEVEAAVAWLEEHPGAIVEMTIATENYLSAEDKARLQAANPDVFLIPEAKAASSENTGGPEIDLNQRIEDLFADYFRYRHNDKAPGPEIMDLFQEIMAE